MKVFLDGDKVLVSCSFQEKETVKSVGDYKWLKARNLWSFPQYKLVNLIDNLNLSYDQEVADLYKELLEARSQRRKQLDLADKIKQDVPCFSMDAPQEISNLCLNLFHHQKKALGLASLFNSYALFLEAGLGKTLIAIRLIQLRKVPTMIVAPLSTLTSVWEEEIQKWSNLEYENLWQNLDRINVNADVFLINYEHFKKLNRNGGIPEKIKFLILDESAKIKDNRSQITKAILSCKDSIPYRLILSGLPAPNSLLEFWPQIAFLNSQLLTDNFYRFRNIYFRSVGYGGFIYVPHRGAKEIIMSKISEQAYFVKKEEALDLPDKIYEKRLIEMDKVQLEKYKEMEKENILEFADQVSIAPNQLAKIMKLREITGGFFISTENIPIKISDSKIKILQEVLEEIDPKRQVIVWIQYHWEAQELKKLFGDQATILYGLIPQKEKTKAIKDFQSGKVRILIAHPRSGGHGLNLQNCSYVIWYSISYSLEEYYQACDRVFRLGQTNKVTYIHLLAKDSIDEIIFKALRKKEDMAMACLEMLKIRRQ